MLIASQTISLEHRKSAGESHVFATFGQGIWVSEKSTENWMEIQSVWTHTWATGHHTLETCMWSIYWPPQPLEARNRVVSPGGGLGSLPKQGLPPETAWCYFPPPPPQFYLCVQICSTITEFLGQVQVTKEPLSVVYIVSTQRMLQTQAGAKWEITSFLGRLRNPHPII